MTPSGTACARLGYFIHSLGIDVRSHRLYAPAEQDGGRPASKIFVFAAVTSEGGSRGNR